MATRIHIESRGHSVNGGVFVITAPDIHIPFIGSLSGVQAAARALKRMLDTVYMDVELNAVPQHRSRTSAPASERPAPPARKASWWDRLHARNRAAGITSEHLHEDDRDFDRIAREARDIDRTVTRLKKRDKTVKPAKRARRRA